MEEYHLLPSHHFSHEHPLEITNSTPKTNTTCYGCNLTISQDKHFQYHKCQTCSFSLHQVCYNMPQKVNHPADPNHHFTLHTTPPSFGGSLNCKACGHHVNNGFYYHCYADNYYHILCLAAPLSISTPSHHHMLRLEYSPPYDFQCDLCEKPSFSGWLYRCGVCEFDVHLACALQNLSLTNSRNKQHELMELLSRGAKGVKMVKDQSMPQDQSNPLWEDRSFLSYQFSDACFSIDFAKSLLRNGDKHNEMEIKEVKWSNGIVDDPNLKGVKEESGNVKSPRISGQNRGSNNDGVDVYCTTGIGSHIWKQLDPEKEKRKANGSWGKSVDKEQSNESNTVKLGCLCWPKLLLRTLFYTKKGKKGR